MKIENFTLNMDGCKIAVDRGGGGDKLLFVPGLAADRTLYKTTLRKLRNHLTVYSMDVAPWGASDPVANFDMDFQARQIVVVLEQLNLSDVVLCASSHGTYLAMRAAKDVTTRLRGVILCTPLREEQNQQPNYVTRPLIDAVNQYLKYAEEGRPEREMYRLLKRTRHLWDKPGFTITKSQLRGILKNWVPPRGAGTACALRYKVPDDLYPEYRKLNLPTLLVFASCDQNCTRPHRENIISMLPKADHVLISAGHSVFDNHSGVMQRTIRDWLAKLTHSSPVRSDSKSR